MKLYKQRPIQQHHKKNKKQKFAPTEIDWEVPLVPFPAM